MIRKALQGLIGGLIGDLLRLIDICGSLRSRIYTGIWGPGSLKDSSGIYFGSSTSVALYDPWSARMDWGTQWVCFWAFQHWSCETAVLVFCTTIAMHRRFRGLRSKRIWITWWILAFSRGPATYTPTCRLNPVNYRTSNLGYIRIYTVEAKKLETGLRPNSAGIPYICITLIRIEATGFPAFRLLLYIYPRDWSRPRRLSIPIYLYIYMYRYML